MGKAEKPAIGYAPRLLRREFAAQYLGISANTLDRLVKDKVLPPAKVIGSTIHGWDRVDLDAAVDGLPYLSETARDTSWD